MIITYLGKQFFKITHGDLTIAINPISKNSKSTSKGSHFGSDIALSTTNHPDYNGFEMVSHGDNIPFEVNSPGDYEIRNIFIKGILTEIILDNKKYMNTIYSFSVDNISICFLGCVSKNNINEKIRGDIESPDILFIPIGNNDLLNASEAYKLAVSLEPKMIIPMDYDAASLKTFLKEGGQESVKAVDKITIKSKDITTLEGSIVVLSS